jgi:hypothetical protein
LNVINWVFASGKKKNRKMEKCKEKKEEGYRTFFSLIGKEWVEKI